MTSNLASDEIAEHAVSLRDEAKSTEKGKIFKNINCNKWRVLGRIKLS